MLRRNIKTAYMLAGPLLTCAVPALASELPNAAAEKALTTVEVRARTEDVLGIANADSKNEIRLRSKLESKREKSAHLDETGALKILEEEE